MFIFTPPERSGAILHNKRVFNSDQYNYKKSSFSRGNKNKYDSNFERPLSLNVTVSISQRGFSQSVILTQTGNGKQHGFLPDQGTVLQ